MVMKKQVLVIEDDPVIGEMISIILEMQGFHVISLANTGWARQKLEEEEIDMVLLDLNLAGSDENGQSFCAYIKSHDDLKHIPVILVSANMDIEQIKKECGADDLIRKPFDLDHFINTLNCYLNVAA
jgi:DNA-binding response OmpR family regulator